MNVAMHQSFQRELNRIRLLAATTLRDAHLRAENSVGAGAMESIRLSAEVEGLGPVFVVRVEAHNCGSRPAMGLMIIFQAHASYRPARPCIKMPLIPPNGKLVFPTKVEELFEDAGPEAVLRAVGGAGGARAPLRLVLAVGGRAPPVLAATVPMPPTDPIMLPFDNMLNFSGTGQPAHGF
ncbi:hypothetical protein ACJJTC_008415 [Scirpophaga incertulas]